MHVRASVYNIKPGGNYLSVLSLKETRELTGGQEARRYSFLSYNGIVVVLVLNVRFSTANDTLSIMIFCNSASLLNT